MLVLVVGSLLDTDAHGQRTKIIINFLLDNLQSFCYTIKSVTTLEIFLTMHLEGPWLSTAGKKRGKKKFRNADEARKSRELDASWSELQKKWGVNGTKSKKNISTETLAYSLSIPEGRSTKNIPSRDSGLGIATKAEPQRYTGDAVLGISTLHKSNAVPVFSKDEAVSISKMRR